MEIAQTLRERISSHALTPGSKLQEIDLAAEFGVSRASIRDALGILEQRKLIRREPSRGAVVVRVEVNRVFELYEVREMLEGLCARLAAQKGPPGCWEELIALFDGPMVGYVETADLTSYIAGLESMRRKMVAVAANEFLSDTLDSIRDQTRVIIRRIIVLPGRMAAGLPQHRAVLEALRAGDPDAAERAARDNIRSARDFLRRYETFVL